MQSILPKVYQMRSKLDSKDKYQQIHQFLNYLKRQPNCQPFISTEDIQKYGIYDFGYITHNPPNFSMIQDKIKKRSYYYFDQFIDEVRRVFISVSDYCFSEDPLQSVCDDFISKVNRFQAKYHKRFPPETISKQQCSLEKHPIRQLQLIKSEEKKIKGQPGVQIINKKDQKDQKETTLLKLQLICYLNQVAQNSEQNFRLLIRKNNMGTEIEQNTVLVYMNDDQPEWRQLAKDRRNLRLS